MRLIRKPVLCNYYLTYRCNATCTFCDIWERPSPYAQPEIVVQNLKAARKLGVKVVDFTGGEPLLHRQLDVLLNQAKNLQLITTVTTNCLLYPKYAQKLKGKIDMLHFSLDAASKEKHDQKRGVACFDFVMESIAIAKKLRENPDILFTVFNDNFEEIEEVYRNIILPNQLVLILNPVFEYNQVETGIKLSEKMLKDLEKWAAKKYIYLNKAFIQLRRDGGNHILDPICKAASSTLVISPDNKLVLPCYHLELEEIPIDNNLYQLYQSDKVKRLVRLEGRLPQCEGCSINCYMQPSFAVEINKYFWKALPGTLKYNYMKGTWRNLALW